LPRKERNILKSFKTLFLRILGISDRCQNAKCLQTASKNSPHVQSKPFKYSNHLQHQQEPAMSSVGQRHFFNNFLSSLNCSQSCSFILKRFA